MTTWELTKATYGEVDYIRGLCGIITTAVERIDRDTVNVTVTDEATDRLVEYCEDNAIPCRLL